MYKGINLEKIRSLIQERGMSEREFCKAYYSKNTRGTLDGIIERDFRVSKLIKICNMLDADINSIFDQAESPAGIPTIHGNNNMVNSSVIQTDLATLKSENEALKQLIVEKNQRISDLKSHLETVISLAQQLGQNSDK